MIELKARVIRVFEFSEGCVWRHLCDLENVYPEGPSIPMAMVSPSIYFDANNPCPFTVGAVVTITIAKDDNGH